MNKISFKVYTHKLDEEEKGWVWHCFLLNIYISVTFFLHPKKFGTHVN